MSDEWESVACPFCGRLGTAAVVWRKLYCPTCKRHYEREV